MTPDDIERVFGRSRLRMVTGEHVEVFREASQPGERRRYTKRFLATSAGDFSEWTEREWRILARLVGHGIRPVPDVVQFDRGAPGRPALVQTYDAGITVDHWATLLPLQREGRVLRNVFEDCAHWWALARHCLIALDAIHELQLVHLDLKADNICIPAGAANFDPSDVEQPLFPRFEEIALIDFAFSLVSGENLESPLPIAHQAEYVYQSPRLLQALDAGRLGDLRPTQRLDWRCDLFSLAAMLWRYLPELEDAKQGTWTPRRHAKARALVRRIMEAHDAELPAQRPHADLIEFASERLADPELTASLQLGWTLALDHPVAGDDSPTPVTQIAPVPAVALVPAVAPVPAIAPSVVAPAAAVVAAPPIAAEPRPELKAVPAPAPVPEPDPASASTSTSAWEPLAQEAITLDRSDIEERGVRRRPRQRTPHAGWAAGLAVATVAGIGVVLWGPWLPAGSERPGSRVAPTAIAAAPAQPAPAGPPRGAVDRTGVPGESMRLPPASAADGAKSTSADPPASPPVPDPAAMTEAAVATAPPAAAEPAARSQQSAPASRQAELVTPPVERKAAVATAAAVKPADPAGKGSKREATGSKAVTVAKAPVASARRSAPSKPQAPGRAQSPGQAQAQARGQAQPQVQAQAQPRTRGPARPFGDGALLPRPGFSALATPPAPSPSAPTRVAAAPVAPAAAQQSPAAPRRQAPATGVPDAFPASPAVRETSPERTVMPGREPEPVPLATLPRPPGAAAPVAPGPAGTAAAEALSRSPSGIDFGARAGELLTRHVPRLAQRAERQVLRVLFIAGRAEPVSDDDDIADAAGALSRTPPDPLGGMVIAPQDGRLLNQAGEAELLQRGRVAEALRLQSMAFGANPLDPDAAGDLAHAFLRQRPAQAEMARQLAMHALTLPDSGPAHGRIRDWTTLAIASALAGRERDARNAWLVTLALAPSVGRQCKAALDAYAAWGAPLRAPVEAMLQRASASGRAERSAFCEWPPHWVASTAGR